MTDDGPSGRARGDARETALLLFCATISVLPLFAVRVLPFTDVPEHIAAIATIAHYDDPAWNDRATYELALATSQSPLFHAGGALLAKLTGSADFAVRLLLAGSGIALPFSVRALLRGAGRNPRLALLACCFFWSRPLVVGLVPFVLAVPITLLGVSVLVESGRAPGRKPPLLLLTGVGLVLAGLHAEAFAVFACSAALLALVTAALRSEGAGEPSRGRLLLRGSTFLIPGVLATAARLSHVPEPGTHVSFVPKKVLFGLLSLWTHDVWRSPWDDLVGIGFWATVVVVSLDMKSRSPFELRAALVRVAPLASTLFLFVVLPFRVGAGTMLNVRLAVMLVLLVLPLFRLRPVLEPVVIGSGVLLTLVSASTAAHELHAMEREELRGFTEVLQAIPPGARVLGLTFHRSPRAKFSAWTHIVAHHRERQGGVAQVSYAELTHWPVRYRNDARPPTKHDVFWEFRPCTFRNAEDGIGFDYLFSMGDTDPVANEPPGPRWSEVSHVGRFRVHARVANAAPVPMRDDAGPCPRAPVPAGSTP